MVKKANGKWRMCTDYTDLNKACPKDPYPLPSIDRLVDGASGFVLLSFMDAYSGYNQIKMHPQDETKTAFITDAVAYCYKDMVVKSATAADHYKALGRVFQVLRKHQLKLNPEKCSFGVQVRKFLGFMLTKRKIEANPEKCQAIINMRSPQTVKEVQQFTRRITALSHFLSQSAEMVVPIFNTLKKGDSFT
ncbi:hypothetical protein CR513_36465, partial [Mucuna pruriens]